MSRENDSVYIEWQDNDIQIVSTDKNGNVDIEIIPKQTVVNLIARVADETFERMDNDSEYYEAIINRLETQAKNV